MLMWDIGEVDLKTRQETNEDGEELLRICQEKNLKIVNTWFKRKREYLITYKSGDLESQIDYIC